MVVCFISDRSALAVTLPRRTGTASPFTKLWYQIQAEEDDDDEFQFIVRPKHLIGLYRLLSVLLAIVYLYGTAFFLVQNLRLSCATLWLYPPH